VGVGIMAAPASYSVNGQQYVVVLAGYGGAMLKMFVNGVAARQYRDEPKILVFKLNGGSVHLPRPVAVQPVPATPYAVYTGKAALERGRTLYLTHCARCHGGFWEGVPSGYPDLKRIPPGVYAAFERIVLGGALRSEGMASFADVLHPSDVQAIEAYLKSETNRVIEKQRPTTDRPGVSVPY